MEYERKYTIIRESKKEVKELSDSELTLKIKAMHKNALAIKDQRIAQEVLGISQFSKQDIQFLESLSPRQYLSTCDETYQSFMDEYRFRQLPLKYLEEG